MNDQQCTVKVPATGGGLGIGKSECSAQRCGEKRCGRARILGAEPHQAKLSKSLRQWKIPARTHQLLVKRQPESAARCQIVSVDIKTKLAARRVENGFQPLARSRGCDELGIQVQTRSNDAEAHHRTPWSALHSSLGDVVIEQTYAGSRLRWAKCAVQQTAPVHLYRPIAIAIRHLLAETERIRIRRRTGDPLRVRCNLRDR